MNARRGDEVYGRALAALAGDDAVTGPIGLGSGAWTRMFARYTPGPDPIGTIAFQRDGSAADIVVVAVHASRPADPAAVALPGPDRAGWLLARAFPDDPRLPGLAAVMAGPGRRTVVRYRPRRRCTIRVEDGGTTRFVKVLKRRADGAAMHRDAVALAAAASAGRLGFAVAAPDRFDPVTSALWQGALPGTPVKPRLLGPDGPALAELMGAALATLHASGRGTVRRRPAARRVRPGALGDGRSGAAPSGAAGRGRSGARPHRGRPRRRDGAAAAAGARRAARRAVARGRRPPRAGRLRPLRPRRPRERRRRVHVRDGVRGPAPAGIGARFRAGYEVGGARLDPVLLAAYFAGGHLAAARRMARARRSAAADRAGRAVARAAAELDAVPAG